MKFGKNENGIFGVSASRGFRQVTIRQGFGEKNKWTVFNAQNHFRCLRRQSSYEPIVIPPPPPGVENPTPPSVIRQNTIAVKGGRHPHLLPRVVAHVGHDVVARHQLLLHAPEPPQGPPPQALQPGLEVLHGVVLARLQPQQRRHTATGPHLRLLRLLRSCRGGGGDLRWREGGGAIKAEGVCRAVLRGVRMCALWRRESSAHDEILIS